MYKEKGSKFLGFAKPCRSAEEAKSFIQQLRTDHPKAVHVCFAWRFGIQNYEDRYSDDGEPNNSAGKPIFGQLQAFEVSNTCIAVVRYYGGTKLGVGGLVNAYKTAAKEALQAGKIIEKHDEQSLLIKFKPEHTGELMSRLSRQSVVIQAHGYEGEFHHVKIAVRKSRLMQFIDSFADTHTYQIEEIQ